MIKNQINTSMKIKEFILQSSSLKTEFYDSLTKIHSKKSQTHFFECFFGNSEFNDVDEQFTLFNPDKVEKEHLWDQVNNGLKYTMLFDYVGSTQESEPFSCISQVHRKNSISDIDLFVKYPSDDTIYSQISHQFQWKQYCPARITDDSSMALCLNHSRLHPDWQRHFRYNLLQWRQNQRFSPGEVIGLGQNMTKSLNKMQHYKNPNLHALTWFFQNKLYEYQNQLNQDILFKGSGNAPLIRSAGHFDIYLHALNVFKTSMNRNFTEGMNALLKENDYENFEETITYLFMLDQHDQSSLTHYGLQGQISILLLSYIQIKLILDQQLRNRSEILYRRIRELIKEFRDYHFLKIINSYFNGLVDTNQIVQKLKILIDENESNQQKVGYLDLKNGYHKINENDQQLLEQQLMILYYTLFYENKENKFNWEDSHFIEYLSQKRNIEEGQLSNSPRCTNHPKKTLFLLQKHFHSRQGSHQYNFGGYAPDCLSIVFYLISKGDHYNRDIFDLLYDICFFKGDSDSYGAVLGTILSSYDFRYHLNHINNSISQRDNVMNHFKRINLKENDVLKEILFSKYCISQKQSIVI